MPATIETDIRSAIAITSPPYPYYPNGPRVEAVGGMIPLTSPLLVASRADFSLTGRGSYSTRFVYSGDPTQPAVILEDVLRSTLQGFSVQGKCAAGVSIRTAPTHAGGAAYSSANLLRDLWVDGGYPDNPDSPHIGFAIDNRNRDQNGEFMQLSNCHAIYVHTGFESWGANVHRTLYSWCMASYCTFGFHLPYGVYFEANHTQTTGCDADFYFGTQWVQAVITDHRSEHSKRFLVTDGHYSPLPLTISRVTWDGLPSGRPIFSLIGNGPVELKHNTFLSQNGYPLRFQFQDDDPGLVEIKGLNLNYAGTVHDDTPQKPISVPDHFELIEAGIVERILYPDGTERVRSIKVRHPDDVSRGRILLPEIEGDYPTGVTWPPDPAVYRRVANPTPDYNPAYQWPRSFAVSFDWIPNETINTGHRNLITCNGVNLRLDWHGSGYEFRAEGTGAQFDVGELVAGQSYRVVVSFDRDSQALNPGHGCGFARFGDTITYLAVPCLTRSQATAAPGESSTDWSIGNPIAAGEHWGFPYGNCCGTITNAAWYDRAMSKTEVMTA